MDSKVSLFETKASSFQIKMLKYKKIFYPKFNEIKYLTYKEKRTETNI